MEKYRSTGICRLSSRHWKILINHHLIEVRITSKVIHYIGINYFEYQDREEIKKVINNRIKKFQEDEK
jgi:hypothetical protein